MKWNSLGLSLVLALGVMLAHPLSGTAQSSEAQKIFVEGRDLFDDGKYVEAEKKFREALSKYPRADQADRTSYYLITTLEKLRRLQDARAEIDNFHRNYAASRWRTDVDERSLALEGPLGDRDLLESERKMQRERDLSQLLGNTALPPDASMQAEVLRRIIQLDPERGIETARNLLKADPSDPAVIANLGTIFSCNSSQVLPFLLNLYANSAASPNARTSAFFFAMRRNPDKEQVANTLMEMLEKKENEPVVSEALFRMTYQEHRAVLERIVGSSNPDKFTAMEKIYRGGSITLRSDLLMVVAKLADPRAQDFIVDAAQNDKDAIVRQAAIEALMSRKDATDVKTWENLLMTLPRTPPAPPAPRAPVAPIRPPAPAPTGARK